MHRLKTVVAVPLLVLATWTALSGQSATCRPATWAYTAKLGEPRHEHGAVVLNRQLYVLGGSREGQDAHALVRE